MLRLSSQYRYPLILAAISVVVLAAGLLLKPVPRPHLNARRPDLTATRTELESLQRLVERNNLRSLGSQFSRLAAHASSYLWPSVGGRRAAIGWSNGILLVNKRMAELPHSVTFRLPGGHTEALNPIQWVPGLPFFLAEGAGPDFIPAPRARDLEQGSWLLAVRAQPAGAATFVPGVYNGLADAPCGPFLGRRLLSSLPLTQPMEGAGVFDLDGELVGVVVECEDGPAVVGPAAIARALNAASSATPLLTLFGMQMQDAGPEWRRPHGPPGGALVHAVWSEWPADTAGIEAGDLITAVDGKRVNSAAEASVLLSSGTASDQLQIARRGRIRRMTLQAVDGNSAAAAPPALTIGAPDQGIEIREIAKGSSAERAGIRSGDRILQIDGASATRAAIVDTLAVFRVKQPVRVTFQRGDCRLALLVTP